MSETVSSDVSAGSRRDSIVQRLEALGTPLLGDDPHPEVFPDAGAPDRSKGFAIVWYVILLLVSGVGNNIFFKRMTSKLPNYPLFLNFLTTIVYIPIFFSVVFYLLKFSDKITPAMRSFPQRKFFVMGALDSLAGLFMIVGGVHTSGSLQALLNQAVIPVTMALAFFVLKERFNTLQYIGASVIVLGVGFVLVPQAMFPENSGGGVSNLMLFNIIFLMGVIPTALSSVYKEIVFTEDMEVNYLQAYVALWQLVFAVVIAPLNSLKFLGPNRVPLYSIPSATFNGLRCLLGINSVVASCIPHPDGSEIPCDDCSSAWIPVCTYLVFNCLYNVSIMLVIKHGSASLMYIASTVRLPIVQLAFSLSILQSHPDRFHWYSIVGLVVILIGLVVYRGATSRAAIDSEEGVAIVPGALEPPAIPLKRPRTTILLSRNPQMIRSGFYAKLGITHSPNSDRFRESFNRSSLRSLDRSSSIV